MEVMSTVMSFDIKQIGFIETKIRVCNREPKYYIIC